MEEWRVSTAEHNWAEELYLMTLAEHYEDLYIKLINGTLSPEEVLRRMDFDCRD